MRFSVRINLTVQEVSIVTKEKIGEVIKPINVSGRVELLFSKIPLNSCQL